MIRGYMAMSADGYVADTAGTVGFLDAYQGADTGYDAFLADVSTVVMGRATFDQVIGFGIGWPYAGKHGFVVTSTDLVNATAGVEPWRSGLQDLVPMLRAMPGDTWVVGGPRLQASFLRAGWLDRLQIFVMPVLLGGGVPLFPSPDNGVAVPMALVDVARLPLGIVGLDYRLGAGARHET
jgi:dihydrofolate reductase